MKDKFRSLKLNCPLYLKTPSAWYWQKYKLVRYISRTIQQYSPPSEWIMCKLGFFPIFLENDLLKVDKILELTFPKATKDFQGFKTAFFHLL